MIGGGVRTGPARAQQLRDRLPTTGGAVIDKAEQRVKAEPLFPGPGRVLFLRVRIQQGGVQIDHHPPVLHRRPGDLPHPFPRGCPSRADRRERGIGVLGEATDQP